jgi:hypothetical protein
MENDLSLSEQTSRQQRHEDAPIRQARIITPDTDIYMHAGLITTVSITLVLAADWSCSICPSNGLS